jgi:hypothetical protein
MEIRPGHGRAGKGLASHNPRFDAREYKYPSTTMRLEQDESDSRQKRRVCICIDNRTTRGQLEVRTALPTLLVSNISTSPAPMHSSSIHSNRMPRNFVHFLVLPGRRPTNSPLAFFLSSRSPCTAIPPSHFSLSMSRGSSLYLFFFKIAVKCLRASTKSLICVPVFGREKLYADNERRSKLRDVPPWMC